MAFLLDIDSTCGHTLTGRLIGVKRRAAVMSLVPNRRAS
jgi:hypothetical protein